MTRNLLILFGLKYRLDPFDRDGRTQERNQNAFRPEGFFCGNNIMDNISSVAEMKEWSRTRRAEGHNIGLVPTMGYLHEGHLSLMHRARFENQRVVASIFVNPTQFGRNEDLSTYPRDLVSDSMKCRQAGVDAIFVPGADDVYGPQFQTYVEVEQVSSPLCGKSRPGHFRGVATVVLKLFNVVCPTSAYFGAKDYQQLQVIRTMVRDLDLDVNVVDCPTVREPDGLAMSSRNSYLSSREREQAVCLYQALHIAGELFGSGEKEPRKYITAMSGRIDKEPDAKSDYISLVHPETLEDLKQVDDRCLAVLAVRIGKTRLIDNRLFQGRAGHA